MESKEIIFDEYLEMQFFSKELNKKIRIVLSDGLYASDEELTDEYKLKIADFINDINCWYGKSVSAVLQRAKEVYHSIQNQTVELINIFVLFEQKEKELFGLSFRVEFDIEHGCGLQIKGKNDNFEIVKIGTGDVAFC
ncbi:MAG: hypothetical protein LBE56_10435 [Tannerella sp.]|jgi:hypothetical protein|nr:hypothetical protein [Tannerella sp.]